MKRRNPGEAPPPDPQRAAPRRPSEERGAPRASMPGAEGEGDETLLTTAELTIPALIDGGAVDEVGPEAPTLPGELVDDLRPVALAGDHYTPVEIHRPHGRARGGPPSQPPARSAAPGTPPARTPPPLPGMTRTPGPAATAPPARGLKTAFAPARPSRPPPPPPAPASRGIAPGGAADRRGAAATGGAAAPEEPAEPTVSMTADDLRGPRPEAGAEPTVTLSPEDLLRDRGRARQRGGASAAERAGADRGAGPWSGRAAGSPTLAPAAGSPTLAPAAGSPTPAPSAGSPTPAPSGRSPAQSDGPTSRWSSRTETLFLSGPPPEESGTASLGPLTGSRRLRRRRRLLARPGLQAILQQKAEREPARPRRRGLSLRASLLLIGAVSGVLAIGTVAGRLVRRARLERLEREAAGAGAEALRVGSLPALRAAAARWADVLALQPASGEALRARAALLGEARYELGGAVSDGDGRGDALAEEAQGAVRLVQGEAAPAALAAQAYLLLADGEAQEAAGRVSALPPSLDEAPGLRAYLESLLALEAGDDEVALSSLRRAVERAPLRPLWRLRLAGLLGAAGRADDAAAQLTALLDDQPEHPGGRIARACLAARGVAGARSREPLAALLGPERPPGAARADLAAGWICLAEVALGKAPPDLDGARRALQAARPLCPGSALLLRERLVAAELRLRDGAAAQAEAEGLARRAPRRPSAALLLARAELQRGQGQAALEALAPLSGRGLGERPEALLLRALALWQLDETLEAQALASRAAADGRAGGALRAEAQLLLARIALRLEEPQEARRLIHDVRAVQAGRGALSEGGVAGGPTAEALLAQAVVLEAQLLLQARPPEAARARALLEGLVARSASEVEGRLLLARLLRQEGQRAAARALLLRALELEDRPAARRELAQLALEEGDPALARRQYEQLLTAQQDPEVVALAARAYRLSGDPSGALALLGRMGALGGGGPPEPREPLIIEEARALLALGRSQDVVTLLRERARGAHRSAALPALYLRALLGVPGGAAQAGALLSGLLPAQRRDPELQLAEARLLLSQGDGLGAQLRLRELLARLPAGAGRGELTDLRAEAEELLDKARRR